MSFVRTLVLVAIAAALGAWLWFVEAPKVEEEAKRDFLLDFDPAAAEKLSLAYPDGSRIDVSREDGTWKLTAPMAYPADQSVVDNFLTTIKEAKIERRLARTEAGALATYGLEGEHGSQARLEVTLKGGKALPAVVLGIATPVGYQAFARREGDDEVLVIPLLLQSSAKKSPSDLRAKTMFPGTDSTGITHVVIDKPGEKIELELKGEDEWSMKAPIVDVADTESVRSMLDSIATVDALAFFDGAAADRKGFGLEDGATRFNAEQQGGSAIAFSIGKEATDPPAGWYFERSSDHQVIKAPDWVTKKLAPSATELRDKRLLSCKADDVRKLTWTIGGDTFTISRDAPGKPWSITPEVTGEVLNQRIVDNALQGLVLARADEVVADAAGDAELQHYGLDAPTAHLDVLSATGSCAALSAARAPEASPEQMPPGGRPPSAHYFVKNATRSAVLRASEHEYSRLAMKRPAFVESAPKPSPGAPSAGGPPADAAPAVPGGEDEPGGD